MSTQRESGPTRDQLLSYYAELCRRHDAISDFRAKLLALLPIASVTGIGLLYTQSDGKGQISPWLLVALGALGAMVTVGLFFFEFHQMDDCQQLRNHGAWVENELGIPAGPFRSRRGKLGLRDVWPAKYRERDQTMMGPERCGIPHDVPDPGFVNVRNADYIVYGTVLLAWIGVLSWGVIELAE